MGDLIISGHQLKSNRLIVGGTPNPGWAAFDGTKVSTTFNVTPDVGVAGTRYINAIQVDSSPVRFLLAYSRGTQPRVRLVEITGGSPEISLIGGPKVPPGLNWTGLRWSKVDDQGTYFLSADNNIFAGPRGIFVTYTGSDFYFGNVSPQLDPISSGDGGRYASAELKAVNDQFLYLSFYADDFGSPQINSAIPHGAIYEFGGSPLTVYTGSPAISVITPLVTPYAERISDPKSMLVLSDSSEVVITGFTSTLSGGAWAAHIGITPTGDFDFIDNEILVPAGGVDNRMSVQHIAEIRKKGSNEYTVGVVAAGEGFFKSSIELPIGSVGSPSVKTKEQGSNVVVDVKSVQHPNQLVGITYGLGSQPDDIIVVVYDYDPATRELSLTTTQSFQMINANLFFPFNSLNLRREQVNFYEYERGKGIIFCQVETPTTSTDDTVGAILIEV